MCERSTKDSKVFLVFVVQVIFFFGFDPMGWDENHHEFHTNLVGICFDVLSKPPNKQIEGLCMVLFAS